MSNEFYFKLILLSIVAIIFLEVVAKKLRLPAAAAQMIGGLGIALLPMVPDIDINPELILLIFLPPLLLDGAYFTVWREFRKNLTGILLLSIGAVIFTTLAVGYITHFLVPALPMGACFALGAIVSPPDAIAAKAILQRLKLPRRVLILLEGESLLNDATGLVLYRFSVAAVLTGVFSFTSAVSNFLVLSLGGIAIGYVVGHLVIYFIKKITETHLIIIASILPAWICYELGEKLHVSGVFATVTYGMFLGWHQHEVFSASVRRRGNAFWHIIVFLLESLVFILIGLALHGVLDRMEDKYHSLVDVTFIVMAIVGVVIGARFVWVFFQDGLLHFIHAKQHPHTHFNWRESVVKSWAGMRGVVTLAIALALPVDFPGRDLILVSAFAVILVTVLVQGTTLGLLINWLDVKHRHDDLADHLTEPQTWARVVNAQYDAVKRHAYNANGDLIHPRLLEQYAYRLKLSETYEHERVLPGDVRESHYDVVLAAIAAGRDELLRLHRNGHIHDETLRAIERDLDIQELSAIYSKS